ncbi:MAG: enoyl-CoA hydratase/isomerase family protein [Deltaproteobacteria bacterium]|nr:enoyl-CoA hydratase/isomerase family protein [Deltaproteobacteria bacterium]MBW2360580.1 enoyl-CoA hydratase/isomerase family protein [Deltaproteobacteria bacterium]
MAYQTLDVKQEGGLAWLTLGRPEQLNALNGTMVDELCDYFGALQNDRATRVVLLRGAGRGFCAGIDLKDPPTPEGTGISDYLQVQRRVSRIAMLMHRAPQPIVSLVHGPACGGGFAMALASDVRIAGESSRMNAAFIKIGLSACDVGVSYFLPRLIGASVASELMLTGRFIHAERARELGLVSRVVADGELEAAGRELANEMLATTPLGLRLTKECLQASIDAPNLEAAIAMEDRNQVLCAQSRDFREGIQAFLEKRPPKYHDA